MIHIIDIIRQVTYITEAAEAETTGHMTHISDWKLYGNPMEDLEHAEAMHRFMNGHETEGHTVSWKIDGETSLTFGKKEDGRHFVAYKSAKNHFHTPEEIDAAGVPWAEAGKRLLKYVTEMNIKPGHVFQGDLLWTNRDKEIHDGTHIKPNTIPYKPTHHDVGIAVHSQYEMDKDGTLNRITNAPDVSQIQHPKVFAPDLQIKPGQVMLTRERNKAVGESLAKAKELMTPEVQEYVHSIANDKTMQKFIQEYTNEVVATTGKRDVQSMRTYLHRPIMGTRTSYGYMEKATQRNKSDKSRAALVKQIEDHINQHGDKISAMLQSMQHVTDAKHHMLDQFKAHQHTAPIQVHGGGEHEGVVSAFAKKKPGMIRGIIGRLAKLTREGILGFSARNRRRGVEKGYTKEREIPHPEVAFVDHTEDIKEEMAIGSGAGLAGLGGPQDVAVPLEAQKRYTRRGPMRRKRKIVESFLNSKNFMK